MRLCAVLQLRTGNADAAVQTLRRFVAMQPTVHGFLSAFLLGSRLDAPALPDGGAAPPPSRFTLEQMLHVLEAALQQPHLGLASEANLLRWQIVRMLNFGTPPPGGSRPALACPPPVAQSVMRHPRILIAVPLVASERERLDGALRLWTSTGGTAPCHSSAPRETGVDLAFYLADTAEETDDWARELTREDGPLGSVLSCFGRVMLRNANLTKAEQYYIGGGDNTGPNNLFWSVFGDDHVHRQYDFMFWMESDVAPIADNWISRLAEEAAAPRGFWRKGPIQQPALEHTMVSTHHYHMNTAGLYRLGQPCYRELMSRVKAESGNQPLDVSTHLFLHDPHHFHIYQQVAHRFLYTDFIENRLDEWTVSSVRAASPDTAFVHGKHRKTD